MYYAISFCAISYAIASRTWRIMLHTIALYMYMAMYTPFVRLWQVQPSGLYTMRYKPPYKVLYCRPKEKPRDSTPRPGENLERNAQSIQ